MPDRPWTRSAPTLTPEGEAFVRRTHEQSGAVKHPGRNPRGERNRQAKLAEAAVRDIRRRVAEGGVTKAALAREYGVGGTSSTGSRRAAAGAASRGHLRARHPDCR